MRTRWIAALVVTLGVSTCLEAQSAVSEEEIKAAFLFNFAKFVTWPSKALPDNKLRLCVIADASFVRRVDAVIAGENVDGRSVTRPAVPPVQDLGHACNILFVGSSESTRLAEVLAAVRDTAVLTVGETEAFASRGGMVTFVKDRDRVRFDVNLTEAGRVNLGISSRLLHLARRVVVGGR